MKSETDHMDFELALRLPNEPKAPVLPLKLAYRKQSFMLLDHAGKIDDVADDWVAANDMAGVSGRIVHWTSRQCMGEVGRYGFEALLLGPGRFDTNCSVWLEFPAIGVPDVKIAPLPLLHELRHASPMSGAEFVLGRCRAELDSIQAVLRSTHPTEAEDEIASHAPWLSAGSAMKVGSRMVFCDEDIDEEVVGFDFPDGSQIAVTVDKIYLCPVTFGPDRTRSVWGKFGHA